VVNIENAPMWPGGSIYHLSRGRGAGSGLELEALQHPPPRFTELPPRYPIWTAAHPKRSRGPEIHGCMLCRLSSSVSTSGGQSGELLVGVTLKSGSCDMRSRKRAPNTSFDSLLGRAPQKKPGRLPHFAKLPDPAPRLTFPLLP